MSISSSAVTSMAWPRTCTCRLAGWISSSPLRSVCALPACKSVRTVTSGPRVISEGGSDYDAQKEARSAEAARQAAASGVVGQADQGGSHGFEADFLLDAEPPVGGGSFS